ncbi:type VI secretion system tip protein TssI/VgrG [Variovorax sp. J22G73]|uniref:type VI secretion system Vgr family protein n=1 Tax=unclassified Variovorax TaxID=663243 RepID=UPI0025752B02|nr:MULTISPECIES: type VI secretion system Vgr family protein [unclassified Variovorax]MDM0009550.1 type VI secretion system tip protein TssI/VgrG [Variovorax sp. J22R203]MDM0102058.1 type VI secretion system tip protein TssI/VgrG [Variovorax sp. J22G73]
MSRTLSVSCSAIPVVFGRPVLEPVRLSGEEGVDGLFAYELWLSGAAELELDGFVGREICCEIELDGAAPRQINALITDAALWGEQGRHVHYKLTLRPWLHLATLRTDCRIFQNQTVAQILDALLANYGFPVDKRLAESYPPRDYQTQFNESDFQFFSRLCQEWGISYHFEHSQGRHRLVLSDAMGAFKPAESAAYREVEYHAPGWKLDAEYIHSFVPMHQLTSGRYAARDYDYTRPRADLSASRKDPRPTGHADGEVYQWHAETGGAHFVQPNAGSAGNNDPKAEGDLLAMLRMQALRTHGARAQASGNLRGMVAGRTFRLQKHPRESANAEYLVLTTRFLIENVAQESQRKDGLVDNEEKQQWRVSVDFTAHPVTEPLRPALTQPKPRAGGCQVAVVVGPAGENIWTDALGRIKVQFPWDRLGGNDAHSSCWLRVSSPWAGNQLGGIHIPRIGQEVIVDFISGDPDLPICTGRVHNQANLPPWALPGQSALSGFRSRELTKDGGGNGAAGRSNHLLMDDTEGRIQAQLKSDHQSSSLSLGNITRVEDNAGRKEARGEGFELRTDGHGVLRAQDGLLITTEARPDAARHAKDMGETIQRLAQARDQIEGLSQAAQSAGAQEQGEDQAVVARAAKQQNDALNGGGEPRSQHSFPELDAPHLVLASPAGMAITAAQSLHSHTGAHTQLTSGGHVCIGAAKRILASVGEGIRIFALQSGIKAFALQGDIRIEAQGDALAATALGDVDIVSTQDTVYVVASKKVTINGGTSFSEWNEGGIRHGTLGTWIEHAAMHATPGPDAAPTPSAPKVCWECMQRAMRRGTAAAPRA